MKTSIEFDTKVFSQNLQRELQAAFDYPALRVKCDMSQGNLKVLIQHLSTELLQGGKLSHIHRTLRTLLIKQAGYPASQVIAQTGITTIRLYLRIAGEPRPYNAKAISTQKLLQSGYETTTIQSQTLAPFATAPLAMAPLATAATEPLAITGAAITENSATENSDAENSVTENSAISKTLATTSESHPEATAGDPEVSDSAQRYPSEQEAEQPETTRDRWNRLKIAVIGAVAIATGTLAYGLTRPCVIGNCPLIAEAQQNGSEALNLLQTDSSAEKVILAYDRIIEANYSLNSIPFWSQYHDQAQLLLQEFQADADLVSQIVSAQRLAREAAITTQNPPHPIQVWEDVQAQWQEAIAKLNGISGQPMVDHLVKNKLADYQAQLAQVNQRIEQEREAQETIASAREAVQLAEAREGIARSLESWQLVHVTWQVVMNRLKEVSEKTMAHAEAQQLAAIYEPRLTVAYERKLQEELSSSTYNQALALAEQAMNAERRGEWSEAVVQWQFALNHVEQVPKDTSYFDQAQSLLNAYDEALGQAEQQASTAIAAEQIRPALEQSCGATPDLCTFAVESNTIRVYLGAGYETFVQQMMLSGGASISSGSGETTKAATLLRAIANAGNTAQIQVEVYNSSGNLMGTYMPEFQGYVQPQIATTADQDG